MSRNNVRGPTSALTEFLREQGITARTIVPSTPRRGGRVQEAANSQAGPSNTGHTQVDDEGDDDETHEKIGLRNNGYGSDRLDESDPEDVNPPAKKRKLSKAALAKLKAKAKARLKTKKGKSKGGGGYDDDSEDSQEDEYTALSKNAFAKSGKGSGMPPIGSFEHCATCEKKFTVTRYTVATTPDPGFLCHNCAKASGADPFKKSTTPRKRKEPTEKRKIVSFEETERIPSLTTICIKIIGKHIDDVDALGDIGSFNMNEIAGVIAKNRSLTAENACLFYNVKNTSLTLYDATNLHPEAFCTLGSLNPNLESLRLDFCGRVDDTSLLHWSSYLTSLTRLELLGPFLVRVPAWISFLEQKGPQLSGFLITQSPRFDLDCAESLVKHATKLKELRLNEIGKLSDDWMPKLATLSNLTSLELSKPSRSLSDDAVVGLLQAIGSNLTHLNLSGNEGLTDVVLLDGIAVYATQLTSLALTNLPLVTDQGFTEFFNCLSANSPLDVLDLSRNHLPSSAAVAAVLAHSGKNLRELSINGWKEASTESLMELGVKACLLTKIDLGWCRGVDDFVIKSLLDGCAKLKEIKCYGCNKVTDNCARRNDVKISGVETHIIG